MQRLGVLSETGESFQTVMLARDASGDHALSVRWQEKRHDPNKAGRMCRIVLTLAQGAGPNTVTIAGCYANTSPKHSGLATLTRDVAAAYADVRVSAVRDGVQAWLALDGQPDDDEFDRLRRRLNRLDISSKSRRLVRERDFSGLKKHSRDEFCTVAKALGDWQGGWSREQVRAIASAARAQDMH